MYVDRFKKAFEVKAGGSDFTAPKRASGMTTLLRP
jgi:hypothetical protein